MFVRRESFQQFIRMYPSVTLLLAINTLVLALVKLPIGHQHVLLESMLGINIYIKEGQLWRLFTPIFLHSALFHFIFNSFALLLFGPAVEQMLKPFRFIAFYILCGVSANLITFIFMPPTFTHLGASGAIFGLIGFYLHLLVSHPHQVSRQDAQMIKAITVISFIMTFIQPNVNIIAHISGAAAGFLLGRLFYKTSV